MGGAALVTSALSAPLNLLGTGINLANENNDTAENVKLAHAAAADAIARGNADAARARMQATQMIARQKVAFASSGVDASVGTAAEAGASTRMFSELDAQTLKNNAAREAWGFKKQAAAMERQQDLRNRGGMVSAGGTALGGIGSFLSGAK